MPDWRSWETAPEGDWALARAREAVIRPLVEGRATSRAVAQAMKRLGIRRSVFYKLLQRYRRRPQTSSLLPFKRGRGINSQFLDAAVEEVVAVSIREFYLKPERPNLAALCQEIRCCLSRNLLTGFSG